MLVSQIYSLVNDVAKESLGANSVTAKDTSTFVSLGNQVLATNTNVDNFLKALFDRVSRVMFESNAYTVSTRFTEVNALEYGAALARVKYRGGEASRNDVHAAGTPNSSNDIIGNQVNGSIVNNLNLPQNTVGVKVKVYSKKATWEYSYVRGRDQLTTAFTSEGEMAAFIGGVETEVMNNYEQSKADLVNLAVNTLMAMVVKRGVNVRHMLTEYNAAYGVALSGDEAKVTPSFYAFLGKEMRDTAKYMTKRNILFNNGDIPTFTNPENLVVEMLTDVKSGYTTYLEADTFNKDLVSLGNVSEVTDWQGGTGAFSERSKISVQPDGEQAPITQGNILACLRDRRAVFTLFDKVYTDAFYNPSNRTESIWHRSDDAFGVDDDYNCVIFTLD